MLACHQWSAVTRTNSIAGVCAGDLFRRELEIRGSYMSSRETPSVLIRLMESGLLDMNQLDVKTFPLEEVTRCVEFAHKCSALQFSILEPSS